MQSTGSLKFSPPTIAAQCSKHSQVSECLIWHKLRRNGYSRLLKVLAEVLKLKKRWRPSVCQHQIWFLNYKIDRFTRIHIFHVPLNPKLPEFFCFVFSFLHFIFRAKTRIHIPHLSIQSCPQFSHSQSISAGWHVVVLFKREPRLNILNMGSTALCEYSTALRARPIFWKIPTFYLQHSSLTPLHVKCSPIEISPRALQFLASVPNIQIYCIVPPEHRNTTWENCWME